jgi:hypothetical protein
VFRQRHLPFHASLRSPYEGTLDRAETSGVMPLADLVVVGVIVAFYIVGIAETLTPVP